MKNRFVFVLLLLPLLVSAINVTIPASDFEGGKFIGEMPTKLTPGEPALPYYPIQLLVPMGKEITEISVIPNYVTHTRTDIFLEPNKQMQPISQSVMLPQVANNELYQRNEFYPSEIYNNLGTQRLNGYEILSINLYPYQFNPITNELTHYNTVEINYLTEDDNNLKAEQNLMLIDNVKIRNDIRQRVINPNELSSYNKEFIPATRDLPDATDPHSMIIITDEQRSEYLADFVDWKIEKGITTKIFLTSDIYNNYDGDDDAEKIKNFIIDAYQTYSSTDTPLEYILLAGDDEIIPIRRVFIDTGYMLDQAMPCDLYYGALDNDWDGNNNDVYGEVADDVDLLAEVSVGRFPGESAQDFANMVYKTQYYVDQNTMSNDVFFGMGENLNWDPVTWGGDYIDEVLSIVPSIEEDYHVFTRYQRDNNYNATLVSAAINEGLGAMNHMGHANQTMVFGITSGTAHNLTNTEFGFAYTQGCYPAAFDEGTSMQSESVAENLLIADGGLFAFIGNTRYGWYSPGNTHGVSQYYDIDFFESIYTNNILQLGKALEESRVNLVNTALEEIYFRWVHYELVIFGDPSVSVKPAVGGYPFISPENYSISDELGDNDGMANPGETVEIEISLTNLAGWTDAENVTATISFDNEDIIVLENNLDYGAIAQGTVSDSRTFAVELPQNVGYGTYGFELTINAPVGNEATFEKNYQLDFEISLTQANWPWHSDSAIRANPIITNIDDDASKEIFAIDSNGSINLLDHNAIQSDIFPLENSLDILNSTAYADIDGDEDKDIVISSRDGNIVAYDSQANLIFSYTAPAMQVLSPVIADLEGDGNVEIISYGVDGELIVLDANGEMKLNFPISVGEISFTDLAVADLDGDGSKEIILPTSYGNLYAYQANGELLAGFPYVADSAITSAPVVLDNKRIAFGTVGDKLVVLEPNGTTVFVKELSNEIASSITAADISADGSLDIVATTKSGEILVVDQSGDYMENWPVAFNQQVTNSPLIADIDNDGQLEIIQFTSSNNLFCYSADGSEMDFSSVPMGILGNSPASLEDIDSDGDFEFITANSDGLFVIDCKLPKGDEIPWNTYRGNYARTGYYGDNVLFTDSDENEIPTLTEASLKGNYPNPFNPTTSIIFSIKNSDDFAQIDVYNVKGQKVKNVVSENLASGEHTVVWNGKDNNGKSVASGVYLYKMSVNGKTIAANKMLLVK